MRLLPAFLLLGALLSLSQCKSNDPDPAKPEDQLPPVTQTGARTFGCLINGQPWTPSTEILSNTLGVAYDPGYLGGALQIRAKRYTGVNSSSLQAITFGVAYVNKVGTYLFPINGANGVFYNDTGAASCNDYGNPNTTCQLGVLVITKFDLTQGIVAGTFTFKLAQLGCDTLRITQGRFDCKL
jgi:hypothetical protein